MTTTKTEKLHITVPDNMSGTEAFCGIITDEEWVLGVQAFDNDKLADHWGDYRWCEECLPLALLVTT